MLETLKNIWKIDELRQRIIFTILLIAAFRFGTYVILPGISSEILQNEFDSKQGAGLLNVLNSFVGGAFARGSIFALGIMPYISASIFLQLMTVALPSFQKIAKEGESGQRKINQYTRYLTVLITLFQSVAYIVNLQQEYPQSLIGNALYPNLFWVTSCLILTSGTLFLVWLGEKITDNGIGNGISLLIGVGILADLPVSLVSQIWDSNDSILSPSWPISPMNFYVELILLTLVTLVVILITTGVRKIPISYARRMVGNKMMQASPQDNARQYIPMKINAAGVMPIIFAQAIMFLPVSFASFFPDSELASSAAMAFTNFTGLVYNVVFVLLVIAFTYFYTAIAVNPNDISEQLRRNGGFIPGVKQGEETSAFIDTVLTRITLPGAIFLGYIAILPAIATSVGIPAQFSQFFGGTSLLIMIGVVLDTLQQMENYLLVRHYDGIIKTGTKVKSPSVVSNV